MIKQIEADAIQISRPEYCREIPTAAEGQTWARPRRDEKIIATFCSLSILSMVDEAGRRGTDLTFCGQDNARVRE